MSRVQFHTRDSAEPSISHGTTPADHVIEMTCEESQPTSTSTSTSAAAAAAAAAAAQPLGLPIPSSSPTSLGVGVGVDAPSVTSSSSLASTATHPSMGIPPTLAQAQANLPQNASTRDVFSAKATSMAISAFKTPKNNILIIVKAGLAKAQLATSHIFLLGIMAGIYVAIGTLTMTIITGGLSAEVVMTTSSFNNILDPVTNRTLTSSNVTSATRFFLPSGLQRLIQAAVFPLALIPVILAGAELFTSNVMFGLAARYGGKTTTGQMLRHWGLSYLGNFIGSVVFGFLLVYLTQLTHTDPIHAWLLKTALYKTQQGWGTMVLKGIGCNMLVCLAVWQALVAEDVAGKILAIWWPLFGFIAIGFEHSIANMFLVPLSLMEGLDVNFGDFLAWNLIPVTVGNILGGGFFITVQWYVFQEHLQVQLEKTITKPGYKLPAVHGPLWTWWHKHMHAHATHAQHAQTHGHGQGQGHINVSIDNANGRKHD